MDNQTIYPRTYRYGWIWGSVTVIFGFMLLGLGFGFCLLFPVEDFLSFGLLFSFEGLVIFSGLYCIVGVFRSYLTLHEDHFEFQGVYRKHVIGRDDIKAVTPPVSFWGGEALSLFLPGSHREYVTLSNFNCNDEAFLAWFEGMPREPIPD